MNTKPRYFIYVPECFKGEPKFDGSPIMRLAEHSRPAYCILDREDVREGGNHYLPFHACPSIVKEGLDYLSAVKLCDEMNRQDQENKEFCAVI